MGYRIPRSPDLPGTGIEISAKSLNASCAKGKFNGYTEINIPRSAGIKPKAPAVSFYPLDERGFEPATGVGRGRR